MKDMATGIFSFSCNACSQRHDIPAEDAEFHRIDEDEDIEDPEHTYTWHHTMECVCQHHIEIDYEVWEYPKGEFSNSQIEIEGGTLIEEFGYDFTETPDEDAFDDDDGDLEW